MPEGHRLPPYCPVPSSLPLGPGAGGGLVVMETGDKSWTLGLLVLAAGVGAWWLLGLGEVRCKVGWGSRPLGRPNY